LMASDAYHGVDRAVVRKRLCAINEGLEARLFIENNALFFR